MFVSLRSLLVLLHCLLSTSSSLVLNTTSGRFQGKQVSVHYQTIEQFFGIPYGEKPRRFELPVLRKHPGNQLRNATERAPGCLQASGGLSYGPFELVDMFGEDCLTLNMFIPPIKSSQLKAIMVFCHGGSNQVGSASLFDGSAIAALGDVIVITINYRLNILGFLTPGPDVMTGNYGLHDQILALKWISINAERFHGDPKRITYVGHSAGAANAVLLAMSKKSDGVIARVIAQSGCPLNQWAIDRNPAMRFDHVIKRNGMVPKQKFQQENINRLKNLTAGQFRYMYHSGLEISPDYPFPIIDNDLFSSDLNAMIREGPLRNVDLLVGVTADEALYFAEEHIFNHYLPRKYRTSPSLTTTPRPTTSKPLESTTTTTPVDYSARRSIDQDPPPRGFSYFRKNNYIKNYLQTNYPDRLCYFEEIRQRYMPELDHQHNLTETARLYTNLVSDLMFYYDLIRFLHERLRSNATRSTYVYYYTNPPIFDLDNLLRRVPDMIGHFAELDLAWGVPFLNPRNHSNMAYTMNISYRPDEIELSYQIIRYWTNFAKTGDPNAPDHVSVRWPNYESTSKSYLNLHANHTRVGHDFLEERYQFWYSILHRPRCLPFRWYHKCLLIGILLLVLTLLFVYICYNAHRSRRNVKPTSEVITNDVVTTTYRFFSPIL